MRGGVGVADVDVDHAGLVDLALDAAVDAGAHRALVDLRQLEAAGFVEADLDAVDRDVGLAEVGAQRVLDAQAIADLGLGPRAGRAAQQLDLAAAGGDHRLLGFERRCARRNRLRNRSDGRLGVLLPAAGCEKGERGGEMEQGPRHVFPLYAAVPERAKY